MIQFLKKLNEKLNRITKSNYFLYIYYHKIFNFFLRLYYKKYTKYHLCSKLIKIKKLIYGKFNQIIIGEESIIKNLIIEIHGNNNKILIGHGCEFGLGCRILVSGNNTLINIGNFCTFTRDNEITAQEDNSEIIICNDVMISNHVIIRTSDSHPIYDKTTGNRINPSKNVHIGNHVWIAPNTKIMKGSTIPDNCIIGSDTTINSNFNDKNCLIAGRPAKVIKTNISWSREKLF